MAVLHNSRRFENTGLHFLLFRCCCSSDAVLFQTDEQILFIFIEWNGVWSAETTEETTEKRNHHRFLLFFSLHFHSEISLHSFCWAVAHLHTITWHIEIAAQWLCVCVYASSQWIISKLVNGFSIWLLFFRFFLSRCGWGRGFVVEDRWDMHTYGAKKVFHEFNDKHHPFMGLWFFFAHSCGTLFACVCVCCMTMCVFDFFDALCMI